MPEQKAESRRLNRLERAQQLRAKAERLEAVEKVEARKRDTRQKVVIGGAIIAESRENEDFKKQLIDILKQRVTRQIDAQAISEWLFTT